MDYTALFTAEERAAFALRALYDSRGFAPYRMSKFEEYDLYDKNKDFLLSGQVITFTDTDGTLLALKPDVTLSIAKNYDSQSTLKVYYNENVYRPAAEGGFREILQSGVEWLGDLGFAEQKELLDLASCALSELSEKSVLSVSHLGLLDGLFEEMRLSAACREEILDCIKSKNAALAQELCCSWGVAEVCIDSLLLLFSINSPLRKAVVDLQKACLNDTMRSGLAELEALLDEQTSDEITFDLSVVHDFRFYSGLVFAGYVYGVPQAVLSGGRYDKLLPRLNKKGAAIGFAVYLDRLSTGRVL